MANNWVGKPIEEINGRISEIGKEIDKGNLSEEAKQALEEELVQLTNAIQFASKCTSNNVDIGWMRENIEDCRTYLNAEQIAYFTEITTKTNIVGPDPCGSGTLAQISKALQKFFTFLKGIKKYYDVYVQGTINAIQGLSSKIASITDLIAGVLRILIQRVRNYIIQKIKNGLNDLFTQILPSLAGDIKDGVIKIIADTLFCKFKEIIQGLVQLVQDFLFSLIGNLINAPFCAAEQFANALINNLASRIDTALKPILDQINSLLGGISQIAGSVFEAIDFILGFESFLCSNGPECPEIKNFRASWWAGPSESAVDDFTKFTDKLGLKGYDASSLINQFDQWTGGFEIFGTKLGDVDPNVANTLECNTAAFACGPPQVQIFGGGGAGAVGKAIVNKIGQVVGVDLLNDGYGYTSPPFVTFLDNCGNGNNAAGYIELGTDDNGTGTGTDTGTGTIAELPIDPITLAPIGQDSYTLPNSDIRNLDREGCVYDATVTHEFDNTNNVHVNYEVSSAIDVEFKGKDYADGQPAIPGTSEKKHYSIKFKVPYEDDQYSINFYDLSNISAAIEQYDYRPDQLMKIADIQNKTRFGFDVWFGREKTRSVNPSVFDTDTYINRNVKQWDSAKPGVINAPEQKLYRMTSRITLGDEFVRKYAVSPYNPLDARSSVESYGGTWTARWEQIEFPLDAEYIVTIAADDSATVFIGNREGNGLKEIGNGLIDAQKGGDETILRKTLAQSGKADTPATYRIKMKKGLYRIRTEVEQYGGSTPTAPTQNKEPGTLIVREGNQYYLLVGGNDLVQVSFNFDWNDNPNTAGIAVRKVTIQTESGGPIVFNRPSGSEKGALSAKGVFKAGKRYKINLEGLVKEPKVVDSGPNPNQKNQRINFFDSDGSDVNAKLTATNAKNLSEGGQSSGGGTNAPLTPNNPTYIAMKIELAPEFYDPNVVNQSSREFYNSYIRRFSFRTVGKRSSCQTGSPLKRVVITNPGSGYLPVPNGEDEFGNQISNPGPGEGDSSREYVGCLTEIQVISTGIGYSPNDTVTVTPNIPGLNVRVQLTEQGQIVRMLVDNPACGVSAPPDITINSLTGSGAEFRPILEFTPLEQFAARDTDPTEIIQVIDCV